MTTRPNFCAITSPNLNRRSRHCCRLRSCCRWHCYVGQDRRWRPSNRRHCSWLLQNTAGCASRRWQLYKHLLWNSI